MPVKKRYLDDFVLDNFKLIGVYSTYENYRLAFFLNEILGWRLKRRKVDLDYQINNELVQFPVFCTHLTDDASIYLIDNRVKKAKANKVSSGLFDESLQETKTFSLLKKYKHIDFLIKIEEDQQHIDVQNVLNQINKSNFDANATFIPNNQIKYKERLVVN